MAEIAGDDALVRRFRAGDDSAFDALCERYRKSVYTSCYAVLLGEDRAGQAASATFVLALRELRRGTVPADVRLWLRRLAHRLAVERSDPSLARQSEPVD